MMDTTSEEHQQATQFMGTIFSGKDIDGQILIWERQEKLSHWSDKVADAAIAARAVAEQGHCVYVGVCTRRRNHGRHQRGGNGDCDQAFGLWIDVDGKKAAARALVNRMPLDVSIVLDSGNGIQAWWLLDQPEPAHMVARVVKRWTKIAQERVTYGVKVDSTHDLARVMRIPGTVNTKDPENHKPVRLMSVYPARYTLDDLISAAGLPPAGPEEDGAVIPPSQSSGPQAAPTAPNTGGAGFFDGLDAQSSPPAAKLMALVMTESKFRKTWARERSDFVNQSQSSYDMSLAALAVGVEWEDREIAELIVAHRAAHGQDVEKALRLNGAGDHDYICRTIARARSGVEDGRKDREIIEAADLDDAAGEGALEALQVALGIKLLAVVKSTARDGEEASFAITIDGHARSVPIGPSSVLISQTKLRCKLIDEAGVCLRAISSKRWLRIIPMIVGITQEEVVDGGPVAQMREAVEAYLEQSPAMVGDDVPAGLRRRLPIQIEGRQAISYPALCGWLGIHRSEAAREIRSPDKRRILRILGWKAERITRWDPDEGASVCRSYMVQG